MGIKLINKRKNSFSNENLFLLYANKEGADQPEHIQVVFPLSRKYHASTC